MIKKCTCKHPYQDKRYGKGYRVHTESQGQKKDGTVTCTACDFEKR